MTLYTIGEIDSIRLALIVDDSPLLVLEFVQHQLLEWELSLEVLRLGNKALNEVEVSMEKQVMLMNQQMSTRAYLLRP